MVHLDFIEVTHIVLEALFSQYLEESTEKQRHSMVMNHMWGYWGVIGH
jgi:hypothetical protein